MKNDIRREWPGLLLVAALIALLIWAVNGCEAANAEGLERAAVERGNLELSEPAGFYDPISPIQVGRNAFENQVHGTSYRVPPGWDVLECMFRYHGQRWAWFVGWFGLNFFGEWPAIATLDNGYMMAVEATARSIDYRTTVPILLFESSFGMGSGNLFGWRNGCAGSFLSQTQRSLDFMARLGTDPHSIFSGWNCGKATYIRNCMEVFRGCDGGDLQ